MNVVQADRPDRDYSLDYLRILACYMVVAFHVLGGNLSTLPAEGADWKISVFFSLLLRTAVPLFFMMSGRLFLSRAEMPSVKVLLTKYVLRYSVMWLVWNVFYRLASIGLHNLLHAGWDLRSFVGIVCTEPQYHLWYLKELVWIYLLTPVLWCVAKYGNGKYLGGACALFLLCSIGWNTVWCFFPDERKWMTMISGFIKPPAEHAGYFLLGYYLSRKDFSRIRRPLMLAGCAATVALSGGVQLAYGAESIFSNYFNVPVCAAAGMLYVFFTGYPVRPPANEKWLRRICSYTLFVYLAHPFVLEKMEAWSFVRQGVLPEAIRIPLVGLLGFFLSLVLAGFFDRIPFLRKKLY